MSKECDFDKRHLKVIPIERSHAAKKTHYKYIHEYIQGGHEWVAE